MLVIYQNDEEVLVCEKKNEKRLIKEYFEDACRDFDQYDRSTVDGIVTISNRLKVDKEYENT